MKEPVYKRHDHEKIVTINEKSLQGWLVIDSTVDGRSCGGLRIAKEVTLREVEDLAKGMTLKHGFIGLARGGAKAGIRTEATSPQDKEKLIKQFARKIAAELEDRRYLSGPDVGSNPALIDLLYAEAGVRVPKRSTGSPHSGYFTSLSVLIGVEFLAGKLGKSLDGLTVAIEGFGAVGSALASHLHRRGVRVIAISNAMGALYAEDGLPIPLLVKEREKHQDEKWILSKKLSNVGIRISHSALLELPVDVLCPCALDSSVNKKNMRKIDAQAICAGANNPVTLIAEQYLFEKGVLYPPDFGTNCGGILGNAMEFAGLKEKHIVSVLQDGLQRKLDALFVSADKAKIPPRLLAIDLAMQNFISMRKSAQKRSIVGKMKKYGLELYRRGFIPPFLIRSYVFHMFRQMFLADIASYDASCSRGVRK